VNGDYCMHEGCVGHPVRGGWFCERHQVRGDGPADAIAYALDAIPVRVADRHAEASAMLLAPHPEGGLSVAGLTVGVDHATGRSRAAVVVMHVHPDGRIEVVG
jgi:hypothetical protein